MLQVVVSSLVLLDHHSSPGMTVQESVYPLPAALTDKHTLLS